jgi:hypothetical protein
LIGNDVADSSSNALDFYSRESIVGCTSTSLSIRFYLVSRTAALDCMMLGLLHRAYFFFFFIFMLLLLLLFVIDNCPEDYLYVSSNGGDFPFCGFVDGPCATFV